MTSKQVVTIGGGTGTFVVLSGLKALEGVSLTAIVTGADDGGSTGRLRDAYGILPPGDARQALVALAEEGSVMRDLFSYRFTKSDVAGHSLGNLLITALADLFGSDERAFAEASKILRIRGSVITATDRPATLCARLTDGTVLVGEHLISEAPSTPRASIEEVYLQSSLPLAAGATAALGGADAIVLGPGRLYSSTIAALLPEGMREAIQNSSARLIYVANLFTCAGETDGYTLGDHVREIARYAGREPETILVHSGVFSEEVLARYSEEQEFPIVDDMTNDTRVTRTSLAAVHVVQPIENDPVRRSLMRHDSEKLGTALAACL